MKIGFLGSAHKIHIYRWATWLAAHGHEVIMFTDARPPEDWNYSGVRIVHPHWNLWRKFIVFKWRGGKYANNREKWRAYRSLILREKPDILHAHEALAYGPTLAHFPEFPRVLSPWGPDIEMLGDPNADPEAQALVRQAVASADIFTTNAPGLEDHWSRLTGMPREKFHLFSWGVDLNIFYPRGFSEQQALREQLGIPLDRQLIVSPRLAQPYYNIDQIMRAWEQLMVNCELNGEEHNYSLVIMRAGAFDEPWQALQSLARELNLPSLIMVDALLNQDEMAMLYSTCEAMVMIPRTDLVASSLVEGMACGCFPIVADLPCYRAVLSESQTRNMGMARFTTDGLREAMEWWLEQDEETRDRLNQHNIDYSRREQDWDLCAAKLVEVYMRMKANT